jgi:uracil permease
MSSITRPKDPAGKMILLGVQHTFAMFGATVLVPALTGLDPAMALLCAGLGTIVFHLVTKNRVPTFLGSSFAFIAAITTVTKMMSGQEDIANAGYQAALPYATGGIVVAGLVYLVLALLVKVFGVEKIRSFFPPLVTGVTIIVIGLMLAPTAISSITTPIVKADGVEVGNWVNWTVAAITVLSMFVVSIFAKGFFKLVPILIGIVVGYVAAALLGVVNVAPIAEAAWFRLPGFFLPKFDISCILIIGPIAIVTFVEHMGDVAASSAVTGEDYMTDPGLHRTLIGDGLATMLAGFIGGPANTTYSENTGVLAATKNYNPTTLLIAAVFAILMAFIGKLGAILQTLPGPVMGGISVVLFGMIATVGLRTLIENGVDFKNTRNLLIAAVMLVLGLGAGGALSIGGVEISGVALCALLGIILNKALPENFDVAGAKKTGKKTK